MTAAALLKLIPARCLKALALQTQVDHQVKKLSGEVMFKLILFLIAVGHVLGIKDMEEKKRLKNKHLELWDTLSTVLGKTRRGKEQKLPASIVNIFEKAVKEGGKLDKATEIDLNERISRFAMEEMEKLYAMERRNQILRARKKCTKFN